MDDLLMQFGQKWEEKTIKTDFHWAENTNKSIVKPLFLIADSMHVAVQVQKKNISNEVQS